jgi:predicted AlkP superfamily phosphohydrolase/phosphomutase
VYINRLLETLGYLKVKGLQGGQRGKLMRQFIKVGEAVDRWHILFRLVYIPKIRKIVKRVDRRSRTCDIDYAQTQAFATDDLGSIYINDLRFDQATVSAREYKKVQQSLIRSLELFSSSGIGQGVFTEVLSREQAFGKNSSLRAPDIVVRFAPDVELSYLYEAGSRAIVPCTGFNHHHLGIWMCSGDNFAPARKFDAHIMDLAPTILSYFGKEVPPEMEGRVLTEILDRG